MPGIGAPFYHLGTTKKDQNPFQRRDFTPQEQVDNALFISRGLFRENKSPVCSERSPDLFDRKRTERESAGWISMACRLSLSSLFFLMTT